MKIAGHYRGIPGYWYGERWVATLYGWNKIREIVRDFADNRCQRCGLHTVLGDCHHRYGRGSGKRDDRVFRPDGSPNLLYLCRRCHNREPILRREPVNQ